MTFKTLYGRDVSGRFLVLGFVVAVLSACVPTVSISAVTPNKGLVAGGYTVTIAGAGFDSQTTATLGGNALTQISVASSGASLTGKAPAGAAGSVDVVVTTGAGQNLGWLDLGCTAGDRVQAQDQYSTERCPRAERDHWRGLCDRYGPAPRVWQRRAPGGF